MCGPKIENKVVSIHEQMKKCSHRFGWYNKICDKCIAYSYCKRMFLDRIKVPKSAIIKKKGKSPKSPRFFNFKRSNNE